MLVGASEFNMTVMSCGLPLAGGPGSVAESVEHGSLMWEFVSSNRGRVKPMTYKLDTYRYQARCSALLG